MSDYNNKIQNATTKYVLIYFGWQFTRFFAINKTGRLINNSEQSQKQQTPIQSVTGVEQE